LPNYAPVAGTDGALYGLTGYGGEHGNGVFYQLVPPASPGSAWTESALYSFMIPPIVPLVPGPGGSFYEVAEPGAFDTGFMLWIQPPASPGAPWTFTTVCNFPADGPVSSIVSAPGGLFYGVGAGSSDTAGFVTEISAYATGGTCAERVLYAFGGTGTYIEYPNTLIRAEDGTLYGTTVVGGAFELTPPASAGGTWTYTQLQTFGYYQPRTPLLLHDGKLYGTLDEYYEGKIPSGIIFELAPPAASGSEWTLTYLHQFTNGQVPEGVLVMDPAGGIWGATAAFGTTEPSGTIYRIVP
jgi:hypothetical protein